MKKAVVFTILTLAVVLIAAALLVFQPKAAPQFVTAPVLRQSLISTVTATGTVNPQDTILIGSQDSGTIEAIFADYNDYVHQGQVLARLDPTLFEANLDQAQGTLDQAQGEYAATLAAVSLAETAIVRDRAALSLARITLRRDGALLHQGYIPQSQYDADSSNLVATETTLNGAIAQVDEAQKTSAAEQDAVVAAQAQVHQAQINLNHTIITSPANGTVIERNVSVGQTVAAALQAPTLFTLGKDLSKMEIDLNVGEPDIGNVRVGDRVDFTVLAYPNDIFHGSVAQIRENPTTVQNVVTYDTVVYENNKDGRLRPGMTPTASIQVARVDDALIVPLVALSFAAAQAQVPTQHPAPSPASRATPGSPWGNVGNAETAAYVAGSQGEVVVVNQGHATFIAVRVILVSGGRAAVVPLSEYLLSPGEQVAVSFAAGQNQTPASRGLFAFR